MSPAETVPGRAVAVIQARLGSARLPRKVLLPLAGAPVIARIAERVARVQGLSAAVVALPAEPGWEELVVACDRHAVATFVFDGDPDDLLGRYLACGGHYRADLVLAVMGDSPLLHPETATRMIAALRADPAADFVRIAPAGIEGGVACARLRALRRIDREGARGPYREHAFLRLSHEPASFRAAVIPPDPALCDPADRFRLTLDTPADYAVIGALYQRLHRPGTIVELRDALALLRREVALARTNAHVVQKDPLAASARVLLAARGYPLPPGLVRLGRDLCERHHAGVTFLVTRGPAPARVAGLPLLVAPDPAEAARELGAAALVVAAAELARAPLAAALAGAVAVIPFHESDPGATVVGLRQSGALRRAVAA